MNFYGRLYHVPGASGSSPGKQNRAQRLRPWQEALSASGPTLERAADHELMIGIFHQLKAEGGQAPGPDGVTYDSIGNTEVAILAREASKAIKQGTYRPGPTRAVPICKVSGGTRTLTVGNIIDRVVAKAVTLTVTPTYEKIFRAGSYGFRPHTSTWHLLDDLETTLAAKAHYTTLAIDDVRKAFDHVPIAPLLRIFEEVISDSKLIHLIETILRGGKDRNRSQGIPQGSSLAPLALNVILNKIHDAPMGEHRGYPPWFRYADNLAYACRDASEGNQILDHVRGLLAPFGLELKGADGPPVDLRQGEAQLLGFRLRLQGDQLRLRLGENALNRLTQEMEQAHGEPNSPEMARAIVGGWIDSQGPAFASKREIARTVATILHVGIKLALLHEDVGDLLSHFDGSLHASLTLTGMPR